MTGNKTAEPNPPWTLAGVQEALERSRPAQQAPLTEWLGYYQQSTAWYAEVAEIDRGHHHEALYCAEHERERAKEIKARISAQQRSESNDDGEGVDYGENPEAGPVEDVDASP
jgi:hypothetical protein